MRQLPLVFLLPTALACGSSTPAPSATDQGTPPPTDSGGAAAPDTGPAAMDSGPSSAPDAAEPDAGPTCLAETRVVALTTEDGVRLEADFRITAAGAPVAALFHMIPPSNDRRNYPPAFIDALAAAGFTVLNVDRRGAGGSGGVAREAYTGPNGALDVAAAVDFLAAHPCGFDLGRLTLVGASNGTTSVLDYAMTRGTRPVPARAVFLTGGRYTENQHPLSGAANALPQLRLAWDRGETAARSWAEGYRSGAPAAWSFDEYTGGGHGTRLFAGNPNAVADIVAWIAAPN